MTSCCLAILKSIRTKWSQSTQCCREWPSAQDFALQLGRTGSMKHNVEYEVPQQPQERNAIARPLHLITDSKIWIKGVDEDQQRSFQPSCLLYVWQAVHRGHALVKNSNLNLGQVEDFCWLILLYNPHGHCPGDCKRSLWSVHVAECYLNLKDSTWLSADLSSLSFERVILQ